jgi:hypothetical protein
MARQRDRHAFKSVALRLAVQWPRRRFQDLLTLTTIAIPPLDNSKQVRLATGCHLARYQFQPCRHISPAFEGLGIADGSHERGGIDRSDARDRCQSSHCIFFPRHFDKLVVESNVGRPLRHKPFASPIAVSGCPADVGFSPQQIASSDAPPLRQSLQRLDHRSSCAFKYGRTYSDAPYYPAPRTDDQDDARRQTGKAHRSGPGLNVSFDFDLGLLLCSVAGEVAG